MDSEIPPDIHPDDIIDDERYLNDLAYRRKIHEDLEVEGDEPIDLGPPSEDDLVFETMEELHKYLDNLVEEVLREIAAETCTDASCAEGAAEAAEICGQQSLGNAGRS